MILLLGTLFLSVGLIYVLHTIFFKKMPKIISYTILFLIVFGMLLTFTVHGIWLALTTLILGNIWIKHFAKKSNKAAT